MGDTTETPLSVFSPSQTNTFTFCPRAWALDKEGWVTRLVEYPELCGVFGTAYAKSMEQYNNTLMMGEVPSVQEAIMAGENDARDAINKIKMDGRSIERLSDREFVDSFSRLLKKAVECYHKTNPYLGYKVLAVEKTYPDHGYCRPDLLLESFQGDIVVVDYKVKIKLETAWRKNTLKQFNDNWQMMHYAWATGATSYAICLVVLGPKMYVESVPYAINPQYSHIWGSDAQAIWEHMQLVKNKKMLPYGVTKHFNEYGDCKYIYACTKYGLSTQQMAVEFIQVKRRDHGQDKGTARRGGGDGERTLQPPEAPQPAKD